MVAIRSSSPVGHLRPRLAEAPKVSASARPGVAADRFDRGGTAAVAPSAPAQSPRDVYSVRPGDTLSHIGARYGVPWPELAAYNGLANPSLIFPGQRIKIPPQAGGAPSATPGSSAPAGSGAPVSANDPSAPNGRMQAALDWSAQQMNPATATGVNSNNGLSVQQDPKAWNNWCLAFVSTAYGRQVPELRAGSAIESYNNFANAGKIRRVSENIPAGAPVFFSTTANNPYGHIAIATGRTTASGEPIIRTSGWNGRDGITELPLSAFSGQYLGYGVISP